MEEHSIKSAREIAMEKVARMGRLTSEELRQQKEGKCVARGELIARRYLESAIREVDLQPELGKYQGEEGEIVRRAFISTLGQSIAPGNVAKSGRAIDGMQVVLGGDGHWKEAKKELAEISVEFEQRAQQMQVVVETRERERLGDLGISGSAIRPNVKGGDDWQREMEKIRQWYDLRVKGLKEELVRYAESRLVPPAKTD